MSLSQVNSIISVYDQAPRQGGLIQRCPATLNREIFRDGILEAIIELGRKQMELVPKNGGGLKDEASPSTVRPDDPRGGNKWVHLGWKRGWRGNGS